MRHLSSAQLRLAAAALAGLAAWGVADVASAHDVAGAGTPEVATTRSSA